MRVDAPRRRVVGRGGAPPLLAALVCALALGFAVPVARAEQAEPVVVEQTQAIAPEVALVRVPRPLALEDFLGMAPPAELAGLLRPVSGFVQRVPEDGKPASQRTDVYLGYDDDVLYCVFVAFDDEPSRIRAHVSRRENVFDDETVEIQIDTFNDRQRAYSFLTNPFGIQWDAIWTEGQGFDESWDAVWQSRGRLTEQGYVVWMAIPFKSLRFPRQQGDSARTWRIILVRDIPRNNETSFWPEVTSRVEGRLNQAALAHGIEDISTGRNAQIIPYATARRFRAEDEGGTFARDGLDPDAGIDAKLVLRDRLALDLTANPDFSQVETDEPQLTVNQRFELFFPEKRPFFLENADFFQTPMNLLFTRRIVDPRGGARLTGRAGRYSLGVLGIDDQAPGALAPADDPLAGEEARFAIARLQRELRPQSWAGLLVTDRRFGDSHNSVAGVDTRLRLGDNWETRAQAVHSDTRTLDGLDLSDPAFDVALNRSGHKFGAHLHWIDIGPEFLTETGFVPRTDIRDTHANVNYDFRPENRRLVRWGPALNVLRISDHDGVRLDEGISPSLEFELRGPTTFGVSGSTGHERLRPQDSPTLTEARDYAVHSLGATFETRFHPAFGIEAEAASARTIHFSPVAPAEPEPANRRTGSLAVSLRPVRRLLWDSSVLYTRLDDAASGVEILANRIARTRIHWQFDPRLSLRAIVQHDRITVNTGWTTVNPVSEWNADLLLTYLVNPWTAVYAGYNTNFTRQALPGEPPDELDPDYRNDARQVFVKLSWLFQL